MAQALYRALRQMDERGLELLVRACFEGESGSRWGTLWGGRGL